MREFSKAGLNKHKSAKVRGGVESGATYRWRGRVIWRDGEADKWHSLSKILTDENGDYIQARPGENDNRGKALAEKALDAWIRDLESNELAARERRLADEAEKARKSLATKETVLEYASSYIDYLDRMQAVEKSTVIGYRSSLRSFGGIGDIPIRDLAPGDVQRWQEALLKRGKSGVTVARHFRLLRQVCKHAVDIGDIERNPTDGVKRPKQKGADPNSLTVDGARGLLSALQEMEQRPVVVAAQIALLTGMREGEVCGLRWREVELDPGADGGSLRVVESVGATAGGCYSKEPKNSASKRRIPISPGLARVLSRRRAEMARDCLQMGVSANGEAFGALYVVGSIDGRYMNPSVLSREWRAIATALDLKGTKGRRVTFHDLRHTFATVAIASKADIKSVSSFLGHANASMTLNIYADADPDAKRAAAHAVFDAMRPKRAESLEFKRAGSQ